MDHAESAAVRIARKGLPCLAVAPAAPDEELHAGQHVRECAGRPAPRCLAVRHGGAERCDGALPPATREALTVRMSAAVLEVHWLLERRRPVQFADADE